MSYVVPTERGGTGYTTEQDLADHIMNGGIEELFVPITSTWVETYINPYDSLLVTEPVTNVTVDIDKLNNQAGIYFTLHDTQDPYTLRTIDLTSSDWVFKRNILLEQTVDPSTGNTTETQSTLSYSDVGYVVISSDKYFIYVNGMELDDIRTYVSNLIANGKNLIERDAIVYVGSY